MTRAPSPSASARSVSESRDAVAEENGAGAPGACPAGLLAWEVYFLAWCAGVWSLREPSAALCADFFLWAGLALFRRPGLFRSACIFGLVAVCSIGGAAAARHALPDVPPPVSAFCGDRAAGKGLVRGRVAEIADKPAGRIELLLTDATEDVNGVPVRVPGRLALEWDAPGYRPAPGQGVAFMACVRPVRGFRNAGLFDFAWRERLRGVFYRAYGRGADLRARWGARPVSFWWEARERLRAAFLRHLPSGRGAAIVLGLVLGERSRIDFAVSDELRAAGLAHTLALSGLNVVYVAALGWALAWLAGLVRPGIYLRIPRAKLAVLFAFPLVAAYVWIGQASSSLVRSALMFGFWGLLLLRDRGRALVDGLFLALALIVAFDPLAVYDLSLQLSAAAVAGLAFLYPWLRGMVPVGRGFWARPARWCWEGFSLSLASNLAILPVSVWCFGTFPPNFLLNLPWLPVQGFLVQIPGMLGLGLAPIPGASALAGPLLSFGAAVQDWMLLALHRGMAAGLFPTWALLRPLWPELLGASAVMGVAPFLRRFGKGGAGTFALLFAGLFFVVWPHLVLLRDAARPEARLTLLDVGQAQAALIDLPGGRRVLVDGGGTRSSTYDIGRNVVGPALAWGRPPRLDCVLYSHPDLDHAQGLVWILRHFDVKRFRTNGQWPRGRLGRAFAAAVAAGAPQPQTLHAGESLSLGRNARLEVRNPSGGAQYPGTNDNSLVLRLVWRGHPLCVLPGDIEWQAAEDMLFREKSGSLRADVLVLPHHGAKSGLSGMLYAAVKPQRALVSCGFQNQFHFPNRDVRAELAQRGIPLAATSRHGMIAAIWTAGAENFVLRFHD